MKPDLHAQLMKELDLVKDCSPKRHCFPMLPSYRDSDDQDQVLDSDNSEDEDDEKINRLDSMILSHGLRRVQSGADCIITDRDEFLRVQHDAKVCVVVKYDQILTANDGKKTKK